LPKNEDNKIDECYEAFSMVNSDNYKENEWVLLVNGNQVYHHYEEEKVLIYAQTHYPTEVPCLVKVPSKHPMIP
jgi:hypothetical protein